MKYLKLYKELSIFESKNNLVLDIEDIFLELKDNDGYQVTHTNTSNSTLPFVFSDEFIIYKKGDSGYTLDSQGIALFNLHDINEELIRFKEICDVNNIKCRFIVSDGQYTLLITDKIYNLSQINRDDVLSVTHLHLKTLSNTNGYIDIENVKFCSCQILKD